MNKLNEIYVEFPGKSENEGFARILVAGIISQIDPLLEDVEDVKTAVSEAVTNSIIHGYNNNGGKIIMKIELFRNRVEIIIEDKGNGIENLELARQPLFTSRPELERSGMGFTLMESFMDDLEIQSIKGEGTKIFMKKYFQN